MKKQHYLIPHHFDGESKDLEYSTELKNVAEAEDLFVDAKERLWLVNEWSKIATGLNVQLHLADNHGKLVNRRARPGDHIRLNFNGSEVPTAAPDFDWVIIEAIEYDDYPDENRETFALRLRPAFNPAGNQEAMPEPPKEEATSTLVITRNLSTVRSTYHGRNEIEKTASNDNTPFNNPWLGLTEEQWELLLQTFIEPL